MGVGMMMVYAGYGWENIKVVEKRHPGLDRIVCSMALGTPLAMALEQGFACLPHPASGPCIPSRVGPSMSARTAPSKCLPMTPST